MAARSDIPKAVRDKVLARDSYSGCPCCIWCGRPSVDGIGLHLHHVIRRSQLGKNTEDNLVTLCFDCHMKLHDGDTEIQTYVKDYLRRLYDTL